MPQIVVPAGAWQAARSLGDYTLVGCTVAPGFDSNFEHPTISELVAGRLRFGRQKARLGLLQFALSPRVTDRWGSEFSCGAHR